MEFYLEQSAVAGKDDQVDDALCIIFQACLGIFQMWILQYTGSFDNESPKKQADTQKLLDEYARLKVWGRENKAVLRPEAHGSLDDTLRHEPEVARNVRDILQQLKKLLQIAASFYSTTKTDDGDSDCSDVESMSGSDEDDNHSEEQELFVQVSGQIKLLYHFASLLRRQGLQGRYLKSARTVDSDAVTALLPYYLGHLEEMIREWGFSQQHPRRAFHDPNDQNPADLGSTLCRASGWFGSGTLKIILERCAHANIRRFEQLRYWEKRPFIEATVGLPEVSPFEPHADKGDTRKSGGHVGKRNRGGNASEGKTLMSTQTAQTFSTVARSAIFDAQTVTGRPKTVYAPSNVGDKLLAGVPTLPPAAQSRDNADFECPYCHAQLNSEKMRDRDCWKRHVFRDLRPYICTFPKCPSAAKMYATRHEWITHEMQLHRRQWKCNECSINFEAEGEMRDHLEDRHSGAWEPRQLYVLLDMSERPIDDDTLAECPLCPVTEPLGRLLKHLAGHLEEISLFVLPTQSAHDGADGDTGDVDSKRVAVLSRRSDGISMTGTTPEIRHFVSAGESAKLVKHVFDELHAREDPSHGVIVDNWQDELPENQPDKATSISAAPTEMTVPPMRIKCLCGDSDTLGSLTYCENCDTFQHAKCFPSIGSKGSDFYHLCHECVFWRKSDLATLTTGAQQATNAHHGSGNRGETESKSSTGSPQRVELTRSSTYSPQPSTSASLLSPSKFSNISELYEHVLDPLDRDLV